MEDTKNMTRGMSARVKIYNLKMEVLTAYENPPKSKEIG